MALFVKELHSYSDSVNNGINDETTKLLTELVSDVDKLMQHAEINENATISSDTHENQFISGLNEEIFQIRRCIVCCLCHVSKKSIEEEILNDKKKDRKKNKCIFQEHISLNFEDFELHKQKRIHKEKEAELNASRQRLNGSDTVEAAVIQPKDNDSYKTQNNKADKRTAANSSSSVDSNSNQNIAEATIQETATHAPALSNHVKDVCESDEMFKAIAAEMIGFVTRTKARNHDEEHILNTLNGYLNEFDSKIKLVPFGSSTYGFGGTRTNFNILASAG